MSCNSLRALLADFRERYKVAAVGGAIVTRDDIQLAVVGVCARGQSREAASDHQWHIGSCAKSMTAALYARMVEQGMAKWNVTVASLFPDLENQIDATWRDRTIDEVFVCQSGMKANLNVSEMKAAWNATEPVTRQRTDIAAAILSRRPGKRGRFVYSNLGYIIIAAAIERITGQSYENVLSSELYAPLGITSGGIGPPPDIWGHKSRWRIGSFSFGRGKPLDPEDRYSDNPTVYTSAGRLHFSLEDWARFQRIFLVNGPPYLKPGTIDHMLKVPESGHMSMGWGQALGLENVSYAMQGSNTFWSATSLLDCNRDRLVLVASNDGRSRVLRAEVKLAVDMLSAS